MHPDLFWERFRVKPGMTAGTTLRKGLDDSRNDISLDRDDITTKALVWYHAFRFTSGQAIGHRIKLLRERFRVKPGMTSCELSNYSPPLCPKCSKLQVAHC